MPTNPARLSFLCADTNIQISHSSQDAFRYILLRAFLVVMGNVAGSHKLQIHYSVNAHNQIAPLGKWLTVTPCVFFLKCLLHCASNATPLFHRSVKAFTPQWRHKILTRNGRTMVHCGTLPWIWLPIQGNINLVLRWCHWATFVSPVTRLYLATATAVAMPGYSLSPQKTLQHEGRPAEYWV